MPSPGRARAATVPPTPRPLVFWSLLQAGARVRVGGREGRREQWGGGGGERRTRAGHRRRHEEGAQPPLFSPPGERGQPVWKRSRCLRVRSGPARPHDPLSLRARPCRLTGVSFAHGL